MIEVRSDKSAVNILDRTRLSQEVVKVTSDAQALAKHRRAAIWSGKTLEVAEILPDGGLSPASCFLYSNGVIEVHTQPRRIVVDNLRLKEFNTEVGKDGVIDFCIVSIIDLRNSAYSRSWGFRVANVADIQRLHLHAARLVSSGHDSAAKIIDFVKTLGDNTGCPSCLMPKLN